MIFWIPAEKDVKKQFEASIERSLGLRLRETQGVRDELWCALTNVTWFYTDYSEIAYSFRSAAKLVVRISGEGDYRDYLPLHDPGVVSDRIREALATEEWFPECL